MSNIITRDTDGALIGYYSDLNKHLKEGVIESITVNEFEQAQGLIEVLEDLDNYNDDSGLLIIEDHNGMGYTVNIYSNKKEI